MSLSVSGIGTRVLDTRLVERTIGIAQREKRFYRTSSMMSERKRQVRCPQREWGGVAAADIG